MNTYVLLSSIIILNAISSILLFKAGKKLDKTFDELNETALKIATFIQNAD